MSNLLQRALDVKRLEPIRKFLNEQPEAYINNLTIAIYGGDPEWIPIEVSRGSYPDSLNVEQIEEVSTAFGFIKLKGDETLFVLDGQHRLRALRLAIQDNPDIGKQQISTTFITHIDDESGKGKTRRLFSIINRHAKPVSLGENILLDEDDLSAILVRKFIEEFPSIAGKEIIALNKTADIKLPKDANKLTTVIALWSINELLINPQDVYPKFEGIKNNLVRIRPDDEVIERYKIIVFDFWTKFFEVFTDANAFINNPIGNERQNGGPFSLRPLGQQIFAEYYIKIVRLGLIDELNLFNNIPQDISNPFWHNILFDPIGNRIIGKKPFVRDYIYYHLDLPLTIKQTIALESNYKKAMQNEDAELPPKLYNR